MGSLFTYGKTWLRRHPPWPTTRQGQHEVIGLAILFVAACTAWWLTDFLPPTLRVLVWGLVLVAGAVLARRGWILLVGPVLPYDLMRNARRNRFMLYRLYAYFVLILVSLFFVGWEVARRENKLQSTHDIAAFAATFGYTFLGLQIVAVAFLTPAYVGGVIADEKDRRTLEYLLTTDLRNREIVVGKLFSRVANLLLMILTGLPIAGFIQLMGGLDPDAVLVAFVATALTALSLASLSTLLSVYARKPREAIVHTYLIVAGYLVVSALLRAYIARLPPLTLNLGFDIISLGDVASWIDSGNPFVHLYELGLSTAMRGRPLADLWDRLGEYAIFHGLASLVCVTWAVARLRAVFLRQTYGETARPWRRGRQRWVRVGTSPMLWKEMFVEGGLRLRWFARLPLAVMIVASFLPLIEILGPRAARSILGTFIGLQKLRLAARHWEPSQEAASMTSWACGVGAAVACFLLIGVAVRAASGISGERDRNTLDSLLTTPLESTAILFSKWAASLASVRWGWLWLGLIWGGGVVWGNLHPMALLLMAAAWLIYAGLLATVGLYFSLICSTGLRAMAATIFSTAALGIGVLLVPVHILFPSQGWEPDTVAEWMLRFQQGLTPAVALGKLLPFWQPQWGMMQTKAAWHLPVALTGLGVWLAAGVVLWIVTDWRFRKIAGREKVRRPEQTPVRESGHAALAGQGIP